MNELQLLRQHWDDLASLDPLWAICSDADKQHGRWAEKEFFQSGSREIHEALELVDALGIQVRRGVALDFGCGVGRLTQALAAVFDVCYGVDISSVMIEKAEAYNRYRDRCTYIVNTRDDLRMFPDNRFDFIYTSIVLQHIPSGLIPVYLGELARVLRPGAVLVFQLPIARTEVDSRTAWLRRRPAYHPARIWNKVYSAVVADESRRFYRLSRIGIPKAWLYRWGLSPSMQMNCIEQRAVCDLMTLNHVDIVHVGHDSARAGHGMISGLFVGVKAA